ncbi:MAG TPA: hypothetical protein VIY08_00035 [Candidatus Nitrosocosmicus sp.]
MLNENQSEHLQFNINQNYKRHGETSSKNDNGLTDISELFQDDYVSHRGSRHLDLMRVMESIIRKYEKDLELEEIKKIGYEWNQKHCQPPLEDNEVEKQWNCASGFIKNVTATPHNNMLENERYITKKSMLIPKFIIMPIVLIRKLEVIKLI